MHWRQWSHWPILLIYRIANEVELPAYLQACAGMTIDQEDIDAFTEAALQWWRANATKFLAWAKAARIVFALSPNYARVSVSLH